MSDDEEEAFFRSQMARLEGNQDSGKKGRGVGSMQEREEKEFFRHQMAKLDVRDDSPPRPTPDKKQGGYLGKLRGITGSSNKKGAKSYNTKSAGGGNTPKPPALPAKNVPPGSAAAATAKKSTPLAQAPSKSSGGGGGDDDDSDEELLGISSEDEVEPTRRAALERQETRVMRGQAAARAPPTVRQASMSSRGAVEVEPFSEPSGEPELWEEVDETELGRKVREMRDPRGAAPAASKVGAPLLRRSSGGVELEGGEVMDPLGLGPLDLKAVALKRNSARAGPPPADAQAAAAKILYYDHKFNGRYYLARIHKETGVGELEQGRKVLQKDLSSHKEQLKQLVKEHFDVFISCKNSIHDIHARLAQMEEDTAGAGTEKLSESIRDCDEVARRAFSPLLERQAQVERIRSVQGLLQRFRTLFNLPSVIRGFVRKGEYDSAVHEAVKAKSLNFPVHSGILKRVLEEVGKVVEEFKEVLYSQMSDPIADLQEVENKIRLLLELDADSDPIWHYLALQDRRIRGLLEGCAAEHRQRLDALQVSTREKQEASERWKQLQMESVQGSEVDLSLLLGTTSSLLEAPTEVSHDVEADMLHARLIKRLTQVLTQHLPRFWKLAQAIFSGKFAAFESGRGYSKHSVDEVAVQVLGMIGLYETKVLHALTALEHTVELRPYLKAAVAQVALLCHTLKQREAAPHQALAALQHLRVEVTRRFVRRICYITRGQAVELAGREDWVPAATADRGESPYAISSYPLKFRSALVSALDHMRDVLVVMREDDPPSVAGNEGVQRALQTLHETIRTTFSESFFDFCDCLEKMALALPQLPGLGQEGGEDEGGDPAANGDATPGAYSGLQAGVAVQIVDQRILMLLSNAGFCRTAICPQLLDKYQPLWMPAGAGAAHDMAMGGGNGILSAEAEHMMSEVEKQFLSLETLVGDKYVDIKAGYLGMAVIKYFLEDGTSWATAPPVKGLRDSALELMHPLVAVHAEVYAGCRPFVERAINMLADGLMDALHQVALQHQDLQQLDANAFCQLSLELDYFETVLHPFDSQPLKDIVDQLRGMLMERTMEGVEAHADPDREGGMPQSAAQLKMMAETLSADLLPGELKRTKVNVYCFTGRGEGELTRRPSMGGGLDASTFPISPYRPGRSRGENRMSPQGRAMSVPQGGGGGGREGA